MKTQSYNNFWQRLHNTAREKGTLLRVMFELTYQCNFYCKHCYVPSNYRKKKRELKTKEVFFILDQLANIGCFYLGFTGGEPFLRKDIMQIFRYAKKKGFEVIIYTNGSLINEKIADELAALRPNKVDITIPAMSKNAFGKITGVAGYRDKVFGGIELLHKKGVNLGFKSCVLKDNEKEINQIRDFAASLRVLHRLDDMLSPRLDGSKEPYKYRGRLPNTNYRQSNPVTSLRANGTDANSCECIEENISVNSRSISKNSRLFKCGVGETQAAITPFGELKMCLMIDYPKYEILTENREQKTENRSQKLRLRHAWKRLKNLVKNIIPDENYQCDECKLEPYCKWCPAKAWFYNRGFTSCEPESRRWAEKRRQGRI